MTQVLPPMTLAGKHVRLEPLAPAHVKALTAAANAGSRETYALASVPESEEDMEAFVAGALRLHSEGSALAFVTVDAASSQVVGSTRYLNVEFWPWPVGHPLQRGAHLPDVVEIGSTWLTPAAQRTLINTEAKLLMLTHAFEVWRVHRVSLKTDARNMRSRMAILRIGAQFDGVLRVARIAVDGAIRDTAAYSIVEREWPAVKVGLQAKLA